jgi:Holliday junction resolvasome RuvABC ATP-dependent DNA helicase subunit
VETREFRGTESASNRVFPQPARHYAEIVGQPDVVSRLKTFSGFHLKNSSAPGHVLVIGEEGTGRTTIARTLAHELKLTYQEIDSSKLQIIGDFTSLITNVRSNEVLIVQEIHRLKRNLLELLIGVLRTQKLEIHIGVGTTARRHVLDVAPFTLIGSVTRKSDCSPDLLSCFSLVLQLQPYSSVALAQIAEQIATNANLEIDSESARLIAINSGGRPHHVELLIQRVAKAVRKQRITADDTLQALSAFGMSVRTNTTNHDEPQVADMSGVEFEKLGL